MRAWEQKSKMSYGVACCTCQALETSVPNYNTSLVDYPSYKQRIYTGTGVEKKKRHMIEQKKKGKSK